MWSELIPFSRVGDVPPDPLIYAAFHRDPKGRLALRYIGSTRNQRDARRLTRYYEGMNKFMSAKELSPYFISYHRCALEVLTEREAQLYNQFRPPGNRRMRSIYRADPASSRLSLELIRLIGWGNREMEGSGDSMGAGRWFFFDDVPYIVTDIDFRLADPQSVPRANAELSAIPCALLDQLNDKLPRCRFIQLLNRRWEPAPLARYYADRQRWRDTGEIWFDWKNNPLYPDLQPFRERAALPRPR